jgi:very-short-patch-repair endonuclease
MEFAIVNKKQLEYAYLVQEKSSYEIAVELGTNSNKVLKALKFLQIPIRSYKESQQVALKRGRSKHPTKGKKMSDETKEAIGKATSSRWNNLTQEEKDKICQLSKDQWESMDPAKKAEIRKLAADALRVSSKEGSQGEKYVKNRLEKAGYSVKFHARDLIPNTDFEVDLFIDDLKTAVEIDGPSHFIPIWGMDRLNRQLKNDSEKQGLLLNHGYVIVRIRNMDKNMSSARHSFIANLIIEELESIKQKFPEPGKRLIEIEVKDGKSRRL